MTAQCFQNSFHSLMLAEVPLASLQFLQRAHQEVEWESLPLKMAVNQDQLPGEEELSDLDVASLDPTAGFVRMQVESIYPCCISPTSSVCIQPSQAYAAGSESESHQGILNPLDLRISPFFYGNLSLLMFAVL